MPMRRVVTAYSADRSDELTLRTGDFIRVLGKSSDPGWLIGEIQGKQGLFPEVCTVPMEEAPQKLPTLPLGKPSPSQTPISSINKAPPPKVPPKPSAIANPQSSGRPQSAIPTAPVPPLKVHEQKVPPPPPLPVSESVAKLATVSKAPPPPPAPSALRNASSSTGSQVSSKPLPPPPPPKRASSASSTASIPVAPIRQQQLKSPTSNVNSQSLSTDGSRILQTALSASSSPSNQVKKVPPPPPPPPGARPLSTTIPSAASRLGSAPPPPPPPPISGGALGKQSSNGSSSTPGSSSGGVRVETFQVPARSLEKIDPPPKQICTPGEDAYSCSASMTTSGFTTIKTEKYEIKRSDRSVVKASVTQRSGESTATCQAEIRPFIPLPMDELRKVSSTYGPKIVAYCQANLGKKVGDGECWTLGRLSFESAGCAPPISKNFGQEIPLSEAAPGDVLQMESCVFEYPDGRKAMAGFPDHTAVVCDYPRGNVIPVLEQNPKPVSYGSYDFTGLKSGSFKLYRALPPQYK